MLGRFSEPRDQVAALIGRAADEAERLVERIAAGDAAADGERRRRASEALTSFTAADGIGLLRLERADARNAINTAMLEEMLIHLAAARTATRCACS